MTTRAKRQCVLVIVLELIGWELNRLYFNGWDSGTWEMISNVIDQVEINLASN